MSSWADKVHAPVVTPTTDATSPVLNDLVSSLKTKPGLRRLLRTGGGLLRVDTTAVGRAQHLNRKWLL